MFLQRYKWKKRQIFQNVSIFLMIVISLFSCFILFHGLQKSDRCILTMQNSIMHSNKGISPVKFVLMSSNKKEVTPVKIVLWISLQGPLQNEKLQRIQRVVETMNRDSDTVCNYQQNGDMKMKRWGSEQERCRFAIGDSENVSDADALVFFMFNSGFKLSELPSLDERRSEQLWVMYGREPPPISRWKDPLRNVINWTMSYRSNSDIWAPYGRKISITPKESGTPIFIGNVTLNQWITRKTKFAVGVISRCQTQSHRETLITKMKQTRLGDIDIFGECGTHTMCGRFEQNCKDYWDDIARKYKFYLAFENSICEDYITEKFWRTLALGMVPVVFGGGNYALEAPPRSYINVKDFNSTEDLMKYLAKLDRNVSEYSEYFEWRRFYEIPMKGIHQWCTLCTAVSEYKKGNFSNKKTYKNLNDWWLQKSNGKGHACVENSLKFK